MVGDASRSIQVLNISNVNAQGKTVLNDGKLLELIQKYPFLYNTRVRAYNDNDYSVWAWKNINAAFNRSYENDPSAAFSTDELISRWHILKPLIQCLSKAYDLEAIPQSLRKSVVKISTELEHQGFNAIVKANSYCQNLLLQNMANIAKLPIEQKLALEREFLDFLLFSELESKQTTKLDQAALKEIQQDTEDLFIEIGLKQVFLTSVHKRETIFHFNQSNLNNLRTYRRPKDIGRWVPLRDAHKFIKPCHVRVKRINIEDYLPLAKIIEMNKTKQKFVKTEFLDGESRGIFGD